MNIFDETSLPGALQAALREARAATSARGTLLQMRLGKGAYNLYKARLVTSEVLPLILRLLEDEIVASKHKALAGLLYSYADQLTKNLIDGAYLTDSVVAEVYAETEAVATDLEKVCKVFAEYLSASKKR